MRKFLLFVLVLVMVYVFMNMIQLYQILFKLTQCHQLDHQLEIIYIYKYLMVVHNGMMDVIIVWFLMEQLLVVHE